MKILSFILIAGLYSQSSLGAGTQKSDYCADANNLINEGKRIKEKAQIEPGYYVYAINHYEAALAFTEACGRQKAVSTDKQAASPGGTPSGGFDGDAGIGTGAAL